MLEGFDGMEVESVDTYVMRAAARVNQNRANIVMKPEIPDARRLQGASREVKNAKTVKTRPIR
jgi:hypothetical protein